MGLVTSLVIGGMIANTVIQARAQHKAGKEQQRIAEANAVLAEQEAVDVRRRGVEEEGGVRRQVRGLIGTQKAGYAGQGVDVTHGTAAALGTQTEQLLQSDLGRIRRNAEMEALGLKTEAGHERQAGRYARSAARWGVASTILGGASDVTLAAQRHNWGRRGTRGGGRTSRYYGEEHG